MNKAIDGALYLVHDEKRNPMAECLEFFSPPIYNVANILEMYSQINIT